jgi:hypothetical protein
MAPMRFAPVIRRLRSFERRFRQARMTARVIQRRRYPVLAHIIPTPALQSFLRLLQRIRQGLQSLCRPRRCCAASISSQALGTGIITFSGGEPLLHPHLDDMIRRIRKHGIIATLITNGYLLSPDRIKQLNRAGLEQLQISIDNVQPDDISKKSLKVSGQETPMARRLRGVRRQHQYRGWSGHRESRGCARTIAHRALELGFDTTVGIVHDHGGQVRPLRDEERVVYEQIQAEKEARVHGLRLRQPLPQEPGARPAERLALPRGKPLSLHLRGRPRPLLLAATGIPGDPAGASTAAKDLEREYWTQKPCAPYCTISCVHRVAMIDLVKEKPREALTQFFPPTASPGAPPRLPLGVDILSRSCFFPRKMASLKAPW